MSLAFNWPACEMAVLLVAGSYGWTDGWGFTYYTHQCVPTGSGTQLWLSAPDPACPEKSV